MTKGKSILIVFHKPEESTTTTATIPKPKSQDKGKAIMIEEPVKLKRKDQIMFDKEVALKLQVELQVGFDKEQILTIQRLQAREQQDLTDAEKATLFMQFLEKRRKFFIAKAVEEKRNKPPIQAQQRKIMCTYLKNVKGKKLKDLKNKSFDSIQKMFDKDFKRVPMLKLSEFEIWRLRIEQYIHMMDHALWDVIENGLSLPKTQVVEGVATMMPIASVEDKAQRRLEVKARIDTAQAVNTALGVSTSGTQVNIANIDNLSDVVICAFLASQPSSPQLVNKDLKQIHPDDLKEMDLRWQMAMLTIRAKRFLKKTRRKLTVNGNDTIGFDKSNVECYNYHKRGNFTRECRAPRNQDTKHKERTRRTVPVEIPASTTLIVDNYKKGLEYENNNDVPPPYTGNFMPPKPNLSFIVLDEFSNKLVVENCDAKTCETKPKDGNPQMDLQDKGVIDSRCSRHMTQNMSYLIDYEEIDGGYVAFGGCPKGEKIIGKDHLGKFNGTADEGFFVGYSINSKAFRVFNSRKRIVEENLHIRFSENTPNVVGSGPDWLFDIDALTRTMNYEPIAVGTQSNGFAGSKACDNVGQARKEKEHVDEDQNQLSIDSGKKVDKDPSTGSESRDQAQDNNVNNTNNINAAITNGGLQVKQKPDGIFISQDKYVTKILKKYGFTKVKNASKPIETQKPLLKDEDGEVDVHMYRSMIGSLMYLTSSRPDIMFAMCACARYQVNLKVSHLHAMKRIFRYLKGQPKFSLWYLKDSPFDLVAYTDSDYAGASLDKKSTIGVYISCIDQFCTIAKARTINGEVQLHAKVDGKMVIISEASIRRDLWFGDKEGVDCLPIATIFEQLALMRVESFDNNEDLGEDASKHGRISDIDANEGITLVSTHDGAEMFHADKDLHGEEVFVQNKMRMLLKKKLMLLKFKKEKKFFAEKAAEEKRNKPPTQSQQRKKICTYLKNMQGKKLNNLKNKSFDSIQKMFDKAFKRVNTSKPIISELVEDEEGVGIDVIPLAVNLPSVVDWKIHK
nr:uncharacterized mitochondrial protein AtMg00810-like [Tanacetum cinerariifolium]